MCKKNYIKWSSYIKWVTFICAAVLAIIIVYFTLDNLGEVAKWGGAICGTKDDDGNLIGGNIGMQGFIFFLIVLLAAAYIAVSLGIFLSHHSVEDVRMHSMPILLSPLFLILENGLLNLINPLFEGSPYYEALMGVFSATVVGVITFASLKFSFELFSQRNRFIETADKKPDITITKNYNDTFDVNIERNDCYLTGLYVGTLSKIKFWDNKRTGNKFCMSELIFPNRKVMYKKGKVRLDIGSIARVDINEIIERAKIKDTDGKTRDVFAIFRDMQNYYYFAQLPISEEKYNVIGVTEVAMSRLVHKYNIRQLENQKRIEKHKKVNDKCIKYTAMDWFAIPYNFHADDKQKEATTE